LHLLASRLFFTAKGLMMSLHSKDNFSHQIMRKEYDFNDSKTIKNPYASKSKKSLIAYKPATPGEILSGWIADLNLSITAFALHISIGRGVLSRLVNGHSAITADLDLRLSEALGTSAGHWLALQMQRDLWTARLAAKKRKRIKPLNWDELIKICLVNKKYDLTIPRRQILELRDPFEGYKKIIDWGSCTSVESTPDVLSGAWVFCGTRVPVTALFENLINGVAVSEFVKLFSGVHMDQVQDVLDHVAHQ
jgi:addiction module HigA family antidote